MRLEWRWLCDAMAGVGGGVSPERILANANEFRIWFCMSQCSLEEKNQWGVYMYSTIYKFIKNNWFK